MTDDGNAPTIPDTQQPTGPTSTGNPRPPDARYAMRAMLGKGGMGEVWLAHDVRVDRDIAIKLMRGGGSGDPDAVARFLREAKVQGRLEHPCVVPVHDLGGEEGSPYFAMKRLTGTTLADVIQAQDEVKWPRRTLLARFVDVCLAVEFAHQRGVIHRDLKPANIMLGDFGEAYVLDWGLARVRDGIDSDVIRASDLRGDSGVHGHTEAGAMLGTPGYMAPEQMRGDVVDQRTDVFALGCILFELLTGKPAIPRDRTLEVTLTAPSYRPAAAADDVPPELDDVCASATAAETEARIPTARELADAVQRFLDGDRDLARRRELAATHAKNARLLLANDDHVARGEAMREAGSAIALDAGNREAQAVLARLLLEPPKTMPGEAIRTVEEVRQRALRAMLPSAILVYVLALAFVPIVSWLGVRGTWALYLLAGELVAIIGLFGAARWRKVPVTRAMIASMVAMHVTLLATVGFLLGPLLVLPILMFGALPSLLMTPTVRFPKTVLGLHLLAFVVPFTLEALGAVPASYSIVGGALVLKPWAVTLTPSALLFIVCSIVLLQLIGNTLILDAQRVEQDRAQELLHVQSWQLAQLVRSSGSTS